MAEARGVAWVTGGARNIGRAICIAFAAAGYDVAVIGHRRPQDVAAVAEEVRATGAEALELAADMGDAGQVAAAAATALKHFGRVDVLVNNAAMRGDAPFLELSEADWQRSLDVNLSGVFRWCRAAAPAMVSQGGGVILNVTGTAIFTGRARGTASVAARAGVIGLTRSIALELGSRNVRANDVVLARIDTVRDVPASAQELAEDAARTPLRRIGRPDEVGAVCVFLASPAAAYITGQAIHVNGGRLLLS